MSRADSRPCSRRAAGFTIVEVMMGVMIMAFSITTSITTMQRGFLSVDSARNLSLASQMMQSEIEKMRLNEWTTINAYAPDPATPVTYTYLAADFDPAFTSLSSRFTLTRTTATLSSDVNVKQITFSVTWRNMDARSMTRSYSTYYGRYGLYDYYYNSV